jgi:hypothetical protein
MNNVKSILANSPLVGKFFANPIQEVSSVKFLHLLRSRKEIELVDVLHLLLQVIEQPSVSKVVDLKGDNREFRVVSDLHGSLSSLLSIFDKVGIPSEENPYIISGDILDKGLHSVELLILLCLMRVENPHAVYIMKGNHEMDHNQNIHVGGVLRQWIMKVSDEVAKTMYGLIRIICKRLPVVILVHDAMIVHGCCPLEKDNLDNISESLETFMVWSDIHSGTGTKVNSNRCKPDSQVKYVTVGTDLVWPAMKKFNVRYLIRGHQYHPTADVKSNGPRHIVTIASNPFVAPSRHSISFATVSVHNILVHNINPGQVMTTSELKEDFFVRIQRKGIVQIVDLKAIPGVVDVIFDPKSRQPTFLKLASRIAMDMLLFFQKYTFAKGTVMFLEYKSCR